MNIAVTSEEKTKISLRAFFFRVWPKSAVGCALFLAFLPTILLLFTITIGFLQSCSFTHYLPFLSLISALMCSRFRTTGLIISYSALAILLFLHYETLSYEERLWQMGILFSLAVNFFLVLLSSEEIEATLSGLSKESQDHLAKWHQSELNLQQTQAKWEAQRGELQEEIKTLKDEAEQRRIERSEDQKRTELIQTEIEQLVSQKEKFIQKVRAAREEALGVEVSQETFRQELILAQQKILTLQQRPTTSVKVEQEDTAELKRAKTQAEGLYNQLRRQFEDKSRILSQTRKELFSTQGKLLALEKQRALSQIDPDREGVAIFEKEIGVLCSEVEESKEEISRLEELISHILSQ